ncbi:MAG: hypothetical protein PGN33_22660 [Methylobacterium radiotolerans]
MSIATVVLVLSCASWVMADLFLLLGIAGLAFGTDGEVGTKVWGAMGFIALFFALNAYGLDLLGRHFGI